MKKLVCLIILLVAAPCFAALQPGLIWEIRSGGNANNGGGFNPSNANFITDLTVTGGEGTSATPHVSSVTYPFVDADDGAWVYVKTGTGWNSGVFYKITSQSGGVALLDAATGHGVVLGGAAGGYTFTPTTVQGIGSATPGGNATWGVDYSQQNSNKLSLTDFSCTSNASTTLTTATSNSFTPVMAGNLVHLTTTGTSARAIIGWYEIVSVTNGTNVVLDVTPCNSVNPAAAVTGAVGGGIAKLGAISSTTARLGAVAGNVIFLTQGGGGGFTGTSTETFSATGTSTNPIQMIGYATYRGDGYLGRNTTTDGKLITTNMPSYQYASGQRLSSIADYTIIRNIAFSVASTGVSGYVVIAGTTSDVFTQCTFTNLSTNTAAGGLAITTACLAYNNDIFMTGASGGATGAGLEVIGGSAIGNRIVMSQSSSTGPAILCANSASLKVVSRNIVIGNGGIAGISNVSTTSPCVVDSNTVVGFVTAWKTVTGTSVLQVVTNNLFTDNTTYAMDGVDAGAPVFNANNRFRDPITINNATNFTSATSFGNVTTDGAAYSDYVAQGSGDYRLATGSPAIAAALPASASMGALQKAVTAAAAQVSYGSAQ